MSIRALHEVFDDLPHTLFEQVISYARAIEDATPEIFKDAGIKPNRELANTLVFIAGIRKLFSIVNSNYWIVDNVGAILANQQEIYSVRVGNTDLSRGGTYHQSLNNITTEFTELLTEHKLVQYVSNVPYADILRDIANGYKFRPDKY